MKNVRVRFFLHKLPASLAGNAVSVNGCKSMARLASERPSEYNTVHMHIFININYVVVEATVSG